MAIENLKLNDGDFSGQDISSLPDRPSDAGITTSQLKARFDQIGKVVLGLGRFNSLIDALKSKTAGDSGADNIGVSPIEGISGDSVQSALGEMGVLSRNAAAAAEIAAAQGNAAQIAANAAQQAADRATEAAGYATENVGGVSPVFDQKILQISYLMALLIRRLLLLPIGFISLAVRMASYLSFFASVAWRFHITPPLSSVIVTRSIFSLPFAFVFKYLIYSCANYLIMLILLVFNV